MTRRGTGSFTIASFPPQVQLDPNFAETTWSTLEHAITEINKRNTSNLSFEQLYRYSYNMVLHKHGDFLYTRLTRLQTDHLKSVASQIASTDPPAFLPEIQRQWSWFELSLAHVRDVLMYMDRYYVKARGHKSVFELGIELFRDVVISDSTIFTRLSHALLTAIDLERTGETVDTPLMRAITRMLAQLGNTSTGKSVYAAVFEDVFLERTRQFYAREATLYLADSTCSDYLYKASRRLYEERLRVDAYLEPQTAGKVRAVTERELISKYMTKLIDMENSGLINMLRNDKLNDLRLMYTLFRDIENGENMLRTNLKKEVLERGIEIINNPEHARDPVALVSAVLSLKEKYERILKSSFTLPASVVGSVGGIGTHHGPSGMQGTFVYGTGNGSGIASVEGVGATSAGAGGKMGGVGERGPLLSSVAGNTMGSSSSAGAGCCAGTGGNASSSPATAASSSISIAPLPTGIPDKKFMSTVKEAFEKFLNGFSDAAEYVSLYVDKLLRKDFKGSSDDEVEGKLEGVMALFRYLNEKDAFQRYYQVHLTKRLLYTKAGSSDAERLFLAKMKMDCGYMYTQKMEVMFSDMKISEDSTSTFKERVNRQGVDMYGIDLSVCVLTNMSWPISASAPVELPSTVKQCIDRYQQFYYEKHEGRKLTWQGELGSADMRGRFGPDGNRIFDFVSVPALCVCILMLFNDKQNITYREILQMTRIPHTELIRHLQTLAMTKYRVLKRDSKDKEIKPDDRFFLNQDFNNRNRRVKLQVVSARKENEIEKNQTKSKIDDDRRPVIDTVIVRVMKNRKVLDHNKLIVEVTNMLSSRFEPNPQEIKKRIESLVEREYLERQPDKRAVYQYVA